MNKAELGKRIYDISNIKGDFLLRSGVRATEYFDKYLFEAEPTVLHEIAKQMVGLLPSQFDQLAGLEMGGIPIATAISLETGRPALFVRKEAKTYGTCKLAEGGEINGLGADGSFPLRVLLVHVTVVQSLLSWTVDSFVRFQEGEVYTHQMAHFGWLQQKLRVLRSAIQELDEIDTFLPPSQLGAPAA